MSIVYNWPTSATLRGAVDLNRMHRAAGQEDLGYKLEFIISNLNEMQTSVSALNTSVSQVNIALQSAADSVCGFAFSNFSAAGFSTVVLTLSAISNFRA